jgi:hypothetical protein
MVPPSPPKGAPQQRKVKTEMILIAIDPPHVQKTISVYWLFTEALVRQPREDRPLVVAILPELLRVVTLAELPQNFLSRFWTLHKAYFVNAWPEIIATPGVRYVTELIPEVTRRPLTRLVTCLCCSATSSGQCKQFARNILMNKKT